MNGHPLTDVGAHSAPSAVSAWCWADRTNRAGDTVPVECNQTTCHPSGLCDAHRAEILGR